MNDNLEFGFNWTDVGQTGTLSFGWATGDEGGWKGRPGPIYYVDPTHTLGYVVYETSETPGVTLVEMTVSFECTKGNIPNPVVGWPAPNGNRQVHSIAVASDDFHPNIHSVGLNQRGNSWWLGNRGKGWGFNPALRRQQGHYDVSVSVTAQKDGIQKTWSVDPELVIGGRG